MTDRLLPQTRNQKLEGLEAGRGIAAVMVVIYHCAVHCRHAYGQFPLGQLFAFGHAGVDFFFILSGFIIFHAHRKDFGKRERLAAYLERRVTRIYPLYWLVLAATLFLMAFSDKPFPDFEHIVVSALLSPTVGGIIVVDAWTLQHEMVFYVFFALLIVGRGIGLAAFAAWLAFLIACTQITVVWDSGLLSKLSAYFNFEFFLGMAAAWLTGRREMPAPKLLVVAGAGAFLAFGVGEDLGELPSMSIFTHAGYGLSSMIIVLGLVAWERQSGLAIPRSLMRLGSASYSIYLIHILTIGIVWQIIQHLGLADRLSPVLVWIVLVVAAVTAGLMTSKYAEKPLLRLLRRRRVARTQPETNPGDAGSLIER